ncbi:alanine racemase [Thermosipho melanesiensis]|uniref:Pyridoxal phosphate homeostasis protein n=2 Tax=Thermosipho melanesiensis TaxID=46541 RepID=A6LN83_THEM4|nr:YggS family pyridoxal phosphate-dependent enzyme [Thermosipho melanesiensis]ABR31384.1 alanine racemase domain protein [Thermosipho melanesiensis BI429]APT74444.1 alanine racemase [Thermosipho melanesiensis]OOC36406.1 alanine racemase [Thermosipho melanesiensis]OOC37224.1 alanine racemase [Thermosipho melanesiensis]OOC37976.1 alanine racemase [Thermosipho melanesiensis]
MKSKLEIRYYNVLDSIKEKALEVGRDYNNIKLVAVSKTFPVEVIKEAYEIGIRIFGENYAQELRDKSKLLESYDIEWHYIGRIQLNKLKYIVPVSRLIHSVTRIEELKEINKLCRKYNKVQEILIQVNISGEETKAGLKPDEVGDFLRETVDFERVKIVGFMTMAPFTDNKEIIRNVFKNARVLLEKFSSEFSNLKELSMGMSNDYLIAIEEGATILRIGSKIFGERG